MKYLVLFEKYGSAFIEAESEEDAMEEAKGYNGNDIDWNSDFDFVNIEQVDKD